MIAKLVNSSNTPERYKRVHLTGAVKILSTQEQIHHVPERDIEGLLVWGNLQWESQGHDSRHYLGQLAL